MLTNDQSEASIETSDQLEASIHLLCDNLHVEQGGVVGDVLEVLGVEPPSGLCVAHPDKPGVCPGSRK